MSERDYKDYINDIINSIHFIREFTDLLSFDDFKKDIKSQFAVIRCFEVIGEATKRIPDDFRNNYSNIPWKIMAGMRDRLIHGYDVVDVSILWRTIKTDIPELEKDIKSILIQ
jgi:uncharacterized protein with HEPN domain